jgi:hypothetical protein
MLNTLHLVVVSQQYLVPLDKYSSRTKKKKSNMLSKWKSDAYPKRKGEVIGWICRESGGP